MCGICGYVNYSELIENNKEILNMNRTLKKRGPDSQNIYIDLNTALGHSRLSIIDVENGSQPMIKKYMDNEYIIIYNGEIYNTAEIRDELLLKGYTFFSHCDTEVVLTAYIEYGEEMVKRLNGIFAFAIYDKYKNSLFLCRDNLGIKPLFYTITEDGTFIFASEIKAILASSKVKPVIDRQGFMELFGLGPAHSPGFTYFKNIFELKSGHYAKVSLGILDIAQYWDLKTEDNDITENEAMEHISFLVEDATKRQLVSDVGVCTMLSGGIDSSILTTVSNNNLDSLDTFSIDFKGNDVNFIANDYVVSKDSEYVEIMKNFLNTNHHNVYFDNTRLFNLLKESMIARDMPGMADIDSSMYAFCENINKSGFKVCLSGECSDEIFGGYPWFYKPNLVNADTFPWALSKDIRQDIIRGGIISKDDLAQYIDFRYTETLSKVVHKDSSDLFDNRFRNINYLTIKWFMNTLVERTDRMSMSNSLEVRVPYADYRIFEYVYNLPAKMKLGIKNEEDIPTEKYLLRMAFKDKLPNEVLFRKKSPFPKTYDPKYLELVETELTRILNNRKSKILQLINIEYVKELINTKGVNLKQNWFGQLMTYPQTLAYLIQIEYWLQEYNIEIEI